MSGSQPRPSSFLGVGWSFPPAFAAGGAELALVSGVDDIHQSIEILLATRLGERPMQESFGCALDELLFEEVDQALVNRITATISDALLRHEPRIALRDLEVSQSRGDAGLLELRLDYVVLGTNSRFNMVFPFYLNEAVSPGL
jgi:phage baseplate assembly protein W